MCSCVLGYNLNSDAKTCTQGVYCVMCVTDVYQHTWRICSLRCVRLRPEFWCQDLHSRSFGWLVGWLWFHVSFSDISAIKWRDSCPVSKFGPATWRLRVFLCIRIRTEYWCQDLHSRYLLCYMCTNTPGGYVCSCVLGYSLNSDWNICTRVVYV